jgi:hypothetical protein
VSAPPASTGPAPSLRPAPTTGAPATTRPVPTTGAPATTRPVPTTGVVTAVDTAVGLGTVRTADAAVVSFHCTQIADGSRTVEVGTPVEFVLLAGRHGCWEAGALRSLALR